MNYHSVLASIAVVIIATVVWIYSILSFPVFAVLDKPWKARRNMKRKRGYAVKVTDGLCYRRAGGPTPLQLEMETLELNTIAKVFNYAVEKHPNRNALGTRAILAEIEEKQRDGKIFTKFELGDYEWITFSGMAEQARHFGKGLRSIGLRPRQRVLIFSETRREWLLSAMGSFLQSMTVCTLYSTLGDEALIHGINETEVNTVVTSHTLFEKVKKFLSFCPKVTNIIYFEDPVRDICASPTDGVTFYSFKQMIEQGKKNESIGDSLPDPEDHAIIMYTSGSTGKPKGVILSHGNISFAMKQFAPIMDATPDDLYLAYLPLAHVLELLGECLMMLYGVSLGYSSPLTLTDVSSKVKKGCKGDASILKPTSVPAVPLILDRIYKAANEKAHASGPLSRKLFAFFVSYKIQWLKIGYSTPLSDWLIFSRMKALLGGSVKNMGCGGAPLASGTHDFARAILGINVSQGYGLTETSGCATIMELEDDYSTGRVGPPLPYCDVKLVEWDEGGYTLEDLPYPRGEVIVGGKNVAVGYFKNEELTKECFFEMDGKRWFRTGDIGEYYPDGTLKIIDRKKDLVKLQMGEYVSLGKIESVLSLSPYVDNICICADSSKNNVVAVICPNKMNITKLEEKLGKTVISYEDADVKAEILSNLASTGRKGLLSKFEIPVGCHVTTEIWSVDNKLLTATMKLNRRSVYHRYSEEIEAMYKKL